MDVTRTRFDMYFDDCTIENTLRRASSSGHSLTWAPEWRHMDEHWTSFITKLSYMHSLKHSHPGWIIYPHLKANPPKWIADAWRSKCSLLHATEILLLFITKKLNWYAMSSQIPELPSYSSSNISLIGACANDTVFLCNEIHLVYGSLLVPVYSGIMLFSLYTIT